jgi:hypothetical protein
LHRQADSIRHLGWSGERLSPRANFHGHLWDWSWDQFVDKFTDARGAVLIDPIDDVTVGCQQSQPVPVLDGLQRADPGVESLFREFRLEPAEALMPERNLHEPTGLSQGR